MGKVQVVFSGYGGFSVDLDVEDILDTLRTLVAVMAPGTRVTVYDEDPSVLEPWGAVDVDAAMSKAARASIRADRKARNAEMRRRWAEAAQ